MHKTLLFLALIFGRTLVIVIVIRIDVGNVSETCRLTFGNLAIHYFIDYIDHPSKVTNLATQLL